MFIEITALFSIFHLIIGESSTNLLLADSVNLTDKISDDDLLKIVLERSELLQTLNENLRAKTTELSATFNEHLTKQRKDIMQNLKKFKDALAKKANDNSTCQSMPTNCAKALSVNGSNGVYRIKVPDTNLKPFFVYCVKNNSIELRKDIDGGGNGNGTDHLNNTDAWMVIQRRMDGSIDFFLNWADYQNGFGNLEGEFFIGLDKLYAITASQLHELWIQMEDFAGVKRWAKYSRFSIGGKDESYALKSLGNYSGDAGDSLSYHAGHKFTTKDRDNDVHKDNCALLFVGAWWYNHCHWSNLNGQYLKGNNTVNEVKGNKTVNDGQGVNWNRWRYHYSLKYVHMAIRPVSDCNMYFVT